MFLSVFLYATLALAASYVPKNDAEVLYVVNNEIEKNVFLTKLMQEQSVRSKYFPLSYELAIAYIEMASSENNERYYGRAEAVIKPWWDDKANTRAQIIKAKILQFNHNFSQAEEVLTEILTLNPNNQSARMMRSNILLVTGQLAKSYRDCIVLGFIGSQASGAICQAAVESLRLTDEEMKALQLKITPVMNYSNKDHQQWLAGILAEALIVRKQFDAAIIILNTALLKSNRNIYLLSLKADALLTQKKYKEVVFLLQDYEKHTPLLVRLLIAEKKLSKKTFKRHNAIMITRFKEEKLRGTNLHRREEGYYALYVNNDIALASEIAHVNWNEQKEISDARLYLDAFNLGSQNAYRLDDKRVNAVNVWAKNSGIGFDLANISFNR